ncbi:MAG: phosphoenolpyruvate kinase [Ignavibacteria bacterium]|nr:phosphoenolpyruvate kinase [Ignavibacteria bacterium]
MSKLLNDEYISRNQAILKQTLPTRLFTRSFQPIHTVYGGAHLFSESTIKKITDIAKDYFCFYCPDPDTLMTIFPILQENYCLAETIYTRIISKLEVGSVEDFRIDFEDGYGYRSKQEEHEHAIQAASAAGRLASQQKLPGLFGFRVKALTPLLIDRSFSTLETFIESFLDASQGILPRNLLVTLPKVSSSEQVNIFHSALEELTQKYLLPQNFLRSEIMVEVQALLSTGSNGSLLEQIVLNSHPRLYALHAGLYDYMSDLGVPAPDQLYTHSNCDYLRHQLQAVHTNTGVNISDGATSFLPVEKHKRKSGLTDQQHNENSAIIRTAWQMHFSNVLHSARFGILQGWDLHPAQIPARLAAIYYYFLNDRDTLFSRFTNFISMAAKAVQTSGVFDDAATGQGMINFLLKGIECGAFSPEELKQAGIEPHSLVTKSFDHIIESSGAQI